MNGIDDWTLVDRYKKVEQFAQKNPVRFLQQLPEPSWNMKYLEYVWNDSPKIDYYRHLNEEGRQESRERLWKELERLARRWIPGTKRCLAMTGNHRTSECLGCLLADLETLDPERAQDIPDCWMAL